MSTDLPRTNFQRLARLDDSVYAIAFRVIATTVQSLFMAPENQPTVVAVKGNGEQDAQLQWRVWAVGSTTITRPSAENVLFPQTWHTKERVSVLSDTQKH